MDALAITRALEGIRDSDDFVGLTYELTEQWSKDPNSFSAVVPILRFMERFPSVDYGAPGPLVHFLETFYGRGYEEELLASVRRCSTRPTVTMLNRLINGTQEPQERNRLIDALAEAGRNSHDEAVLDAVEYFLNRLGVPSKPSKQFPRPF